MKTSTIVWILVALIIIAGGAWYLSSGSAPSAQAPSTNLGVQGGGQTNTGQETVPPLLNIAANTSLGNILTASNGMTLYTYGKDTTGVSNCTGTCATNWPPYSVNGLETLVAGTGVSGTLGTITRADGTTQLTYNGKPLYFYAKDTAAGDTTGQGLGGVWYVVKI